jgi:sulfoxide reductase heme-binding subunit YedZ
MSPRGNMRRRLLRYHLPAAVASAVVVLLFMNVPPFDANRYPHVDIFSGSFPQKRERVAGMPMEHGGGQRPQQQPAGHQRPPDGHHGGPQPGQSDQTPQQHSGGEMLRPTPTQSDVGDRRFVRRFTVATGYVALALLALTLLIGPANLLLRRRNPVSSYLRRDVGAWTAIASVVHVIFSLKVHGTGRIRDFLDFFVADGRPLTNSFGIANWTGLAALVVVAVLLALSSDAALRKLKAKNWKRLQRVNYVLFVLVIAHAVFYGALLRTNSPYTLLLLLSVVAVVVGQAIGIWLYRRRASRRAATAA